MHFSTKDILEKSFNKKIKGYDPLEVDTFLDDIMSDYEAFEKQITLLKKEIIRLNNQLSKVTEQNEKSEEAISNYDILKRISNLEKHVFGSQLNHF